MRLQRGRRATAIVLVTPAFPETGRTVYRAICSSAAVPLNESPLKDHPLNPMHDANLVRVLARQRKARVGLVDLAAVGARAVRPSSARLAESRGRRCPARRSSTPSSSVISRRSARSRSIDGLDRRLGPRPRPCARPRRLGQGRCPKCEARRRRPVGGLAAVIAGSCSKATLGADRRAERTMPVLRLEPGEAPGRSQTKCGGARLGGRPVGRGRW